LFSSFMLTSSLANVSRDYCWEIRRHKSQTSFPGSAPLKSIISPLADRLLPTQYSYTMVRYTRNTPFMKIAQAKRASNDACCSRIVSPDHFSMAYSMSLKPSQRSKSRSIPITNGMHRTPSEIQLCEDEALADYRDYCMFVRIVDGISRRQSTNQDLDLIYEYDACLANIRRTRSQPPEESQSLEARHELLLQKFMFPPNPLSPNAFHTNLPGNDNMILDEDEIFVIDL
jgi:hypothetical protein